MNRKRGAPVLIELITRPNGPSVGGSPAASYPPPETHGRGGNPVSNPANWGPASSRGSGPAGAGPAGSEWRVPALLIGAGVVIVVLASLFGYQLGQKREKQDWAEKNAGTPPPVAGTGVKDPLNGAGAPGVEDPNAAMNGGVIQAGPKAPAPVPAAPHLQDGWNYLVVGTSMRRSDAEKAGQYLMDHQIACELVPHDSNAGGGGVDRSGRSGNNGLWQIWVLQGVPGGSEYSKHQAERTTLETKVKLLGRTWKAQDRKAPTDFAGAFWKQYKS